MRLDRLDGVGAVVWSDGVAVEETLQGLLQGLALKPPIPCFADSIDVFFKTYISSLSRKDLFELSKDIVNAYHPLAPEGAVIKQHLEKHTALLYDAIARGMQPI